MKIAVTGKGGVGKTTLAGLFIQHLCESGKGPLLVVDADAKLLVSDCSRRGIQAAGRIALW